MKMKSKKGIWNNRILWCAILFALAVLTSFIKVLVLPQGGCITYFSLLLLWLISFVAGPRYGLVFSVIFGFVRLGITYLTGEYVNPGLGAIILEYPLAHGVFCLGAFLKEPVRQDVLTIDENEEIAVESWKLKMGYLIGVLGMLVCYVISAMCFYPPDREGFWANLFYSIGYDGSYLLVEAGFSFLILCIPKVREAIYYIKYVANHTDDDDTLECF